MLFREVNERIEDVARLHGADDALDFLCECGRRDCLAAIGLSREEYESVRAEPDRFLVAPGHEEPDIERVVSETERFFVVEKTGEAGAFAEASDPRS